MDVNYKGVRIFCCLVINKNFERLYEAISNALCCESQMLERYPLKYQYSAELHYVLPQMAIIALQLVMFDLSLTAEGRRQTLNCKRLNSESACVL